jgi:HEAT repeat protein
MRRTEMRREILLVVFSLFMFGCSRTDVPSNYFSGQPVEHWLEAVKSPDPKTRKKAAEVLGNVGPVDLRSIPALIVAVKDPDPKVRDAVVLSLSKIGRPAVSAADVLREATNDDDPMVRSHATTALERVRGTK